MSTYQRRARQARSQANIPEGYTRGSFISASHRADNRANHSFDRDNVGGGAADTQTHRARQAQENARPDVTRHRTESTTPHADSRDRQTQIREGLSYGRARDTVDARQRREGSYENPGYGALDEHLSQRSDARRLAEQRRTTTERRLSASSRDSNLNQYTRDGSFRPATAKQEHLAQRSPTYGQDHPGGKPAGRERIRGQNLVHIESESRPTDRGTWRHRKKK